MRYKKLISIILSVGIMLSAVSVIPNFLSAEGDYILINNTVEKQGVTQEAVTALGNSIIKGFTPECSVNASASDLKLLTDEAVFLKYGDASTYIGTGSNPTTFTFNMGKRYDIDNILIGGACMGSKDIALAEYELYVSDYADELYNESNKIAYYNSDGIFAAAVEAGKNGWYNSIGCAQIFKFNNRRTGRFFGIKIIKNNNYDAFLHLSEFGVFGTLSKTQISNYRTFNNTVDAEEVTQSSVDALGQNILNGIIPAFTGVSSENIDFSVLTDGAIYSESSGKIEINTVNGTAEFVYDMGKQVVVSNAVISGVCDAQKDLTVGKYEIYVSDYSDDLFDTQNLAAVYNNEGLFKAASDAGKSGSFNNLGSAQNIKFVAKPVGRYFGVKILKANNTDNVVRLTEIGVYGEESAQPLPGYRIINNTASAKKITQQTIDALGENFLASSKALAPECSEGFAGWKSVKGTEETDITELSALTDKKIYEQSGDSYLVSYIGTASPTVTFDIGQRISIDKAVIAGYFAKDTDLGLGEYEIYVSDYKDDLYSAPNLAASYSSKGLYDAACDADPLQRGLLNNTNSAQIINFGTAKIGRYFGIKFIKANNFGDNYIRISDIGVYGKICDAPLPDYRVVNNVKDWQPVTQPYVNSLGINYLQHNSQNESCKASAPTFSDGKGNVISWKDSNENPLEDLSLLTDNDIYDKYGDTYAYSNNWKNSLAITYDMGQRIIIDGILVAGFYLRSNDYGLSEYEVYVSEKERDLYNDNNRLITYDGSGVHYVDPDGKTWNFTNSAQVFIFNNQHTGRYIGIKILKANAVDSSVRLSELGVYGTVTDPLPPDILGDYNVIKNTEGSENVTQALINTLGSNRLSKSEQNPDSCASDPIWPAEAQITDKDNNIIDSLSIITDGKIYDSYGTPNINFVKWPEPMTIAYDMGAEIDIEYILVNSFYLKSRDYGLRKYALYVSDSMALLFDSDSLLLEYDTKGGEHHVSESVWDNSGASQLFELNLKPTARYFGIKIYDANSTDGKPGADNVVRLSELGVYGKIHEDKQINLAAGKVSSAYVEYGRSNIKQLDGNEYSGETAQKLTNNDFTDSADFKTDGKALDLVYDLNDNMHIESYALNLLNQLPNTSVKIFASDIEAGVWEEESLIKVISSEGTVFQYIPQEIKSYRFVRFCIVGTGEKISVSEVIVSGADSQESRYSNVLQNISAENVTAFARNKGTGEYSEYPFDEETDQAQEILSALVDGDISSSNSLTEYMPDSETLDLVFVFKGKKLINRSVITGTQNSLDSFPVKIEYYAANSVDEIMSSELSAFAVYEYDTKDRWQASLDFPVVSTKYLRISFTAPQGKYFDLSEIAVYGISVNGIIFGEDAVQVFTDSDYGVTAEIVRLDSSDMYSGVSKMKVTPVILTASQKNSMISKTVTPVTEGYKVTFFDKNNNEINDFGGRGLRLKFNVPSSVPIYTTYLSRAEDENEMIMLNAMYSGNSISYLETENRVSGIYAIGEIAVDNKVYGTSNLISNMYDLADKPTGDNSPLNYYVLAALISLAAVFAAGVYKHINSRNKINREK